MFKSIQAPVQQPEREDWTDTLLNRGLPLLGAGLAGLAAVPTGGMSLAAIPGIMGAASAGMGAGQMLGSLFQDRPGVGQQQFGQGAQNVGAGLGGMYRSHLADEYAKKQKEITDNNSPVLQMGGGEGALPHQKWQSTRAASKKGL